MKPLYPVDFCDVGRQIKLRRRELGLTQEQVANRLDMSTTQLSRIECGQRPSLDSILLLASALNMSLDGLFSVNRSADRTSLEIIHLLLQFSPEQRGQLLHCLKCILEGNRLERLKPEGKRPQRRAGGQRPNPVIQ